MQRIRYLFESQYGTYYFRYSLPTWYIRSFPLAKKVIFISLRTKNMDVAKLRVQLFYFLTQQKLSQIKKTRLLGQMTQKKTIHDVIRDFMKYVEDASPEEAEARGFEELFFEENFEYYYSESLKLLEKWGLLDFVHADFRNVEELVARATRYQREGEKREAPNILKSNFIKRYGIRGKNTNIVPPEQGSGILLSDLLKEYLKKKSRM